jgi:putative Holliday junction resolvase
MSTVPGSTRGPVLGLDFGERRLGVALSDAERLIATGLTTIDRRKHPDVFVPLATIIRERKVTALVVGYPLRTDGVEKAGAKTEAVDAFVAGLKERFGLPVHLEDEAFTSALAAESLKTRKPARRGAKGPKDWARDKAEIDRVAACFILQDWLDGGAGSDSGFGKTQSELSSPSPPSPLSDTGGAP